MTAEEKQQVQNLINARTKLLTEKTARQEEHIKSLNDKITELNSEIETRKKEIDGLKSELTQAQEQSRKLLALVRSEPKPPEPVIVDAEKSRQKPNYLLSLLRQHFGFSSFRPGQEEAVDAILSGRDVFCSMPDNYGRSVCYRLPALLMPGLTLAIIPDDFAPEISDQHSEILNSSLSPSKRREILRKIKNGSCKILYSNLKNLAEPDVLSALKSSEISMSAIISSLGNAHNLSGYLSLISSISARRITTGIFADETSPQLRQELLKLSALRSPLKIITGFYRENLTLKIFRTENKSAILRDIVEQKKDSAGVIYCSTIETAFILSGLLSGFDGLGEKILINTMSSYGEIKGNDIKFIVHYDIPKDLCSYSKHINISGISSANCECMMLISREDLKNADNSILSFCNSKKPEEFMLSYLGEDESISARNENNVNVTDSEGITPDDVADFDFGTSNEAQKEAATHTEGPLLILAGPGTGKTFTLVQRIVFMIQKKRVMPENIMIASFTDKASNEIITRINEELSLRKITADTGSMYAGTFHSICARILKEYSDFTQSGKNFRMLDEFDHAYLIMQNIKRFMSIQGINDALKTKGKWPNSQELRNYINTLSEELADPEELICDSDPAVSALGHVLKIHDDILTETNSLSYSAILVKAYRLLRDNPEILKDLQKKIKYVMVDEYQDTNYVQEQLAFIIAGENKNICAAGDDDQSIYRFRGAEVRNILEFPERFNKNECRIVKLMINYRSRPGIVKFFNEWINNTGNFFSWDNFRHDKKLEAYRTNFNNPSVMRLAGLNDANEWHEKILHVINALKDAGKITDYSQIAFLFKSVKTPDVKALSQYLEDNNINIFSPRSNMFFQRGEVKFALGCLISIFPEYFKSLKGGAFAFNGVEPEHIAYYKGCIQNVARYIEKPLYSGLKKWMIKKRSFHEKLQNYAGYTYSDLLYEMFGFFPFTHSLDADINGTVKELRAARNLSKLVQVFRQYERSYNVININAKYIVSQFQVLMNIYLRFKIEEGIDEYEDSNNSIPQGHAAFMTIHQAKGMEFPIVFTDSLWAYPQDNVKNNNDIMSEILRTYCRRADFEPSERIKYFDLWRLYYTAFSRAQDLLILTCCEDNRTPSKYFEAAYNRLDDADEILKPSEVEITHAKFIGLRKTFSFTSHILTYEKCPMQYKFLHELEFLPGRSQNTFLGNLIHSVLEDIHMSAINHEENKINEQNIYKWFNEEYENLSRTEQAFLTKATRETALSQIMRYVQRQGDDWSSIRKAEYDVNMVRKNYILEGKIDLLTIRDGETEITDFKSGSKPNININTDRDRIETYKRQVFAYAYLVEHSSGLKVSRMKIYYLGESSSNPEMIYTYNPDEAEKIMTVFDETVDRITAKDFNHKASDIEQCRECVFRYYCERA